MAPCLLCLHVQGSCHLNPHVRAVPSRSRCLLSAHSGTDQGAQLLNTAVSKELWTWSGWKLKANTPQMLSHEVLIRYIGDPLPSLFSGVGREFLQQKFQQTLPPSPQLVTTDRYFPLKVSVEQLISCRANSYDSVYHNNRMGININKLMLHLIVRRFCNLVSN